MTIRRVGGGFLSAIAVRNQSMMYYCARALIKRNRKKKRSLEPCFHV